MMAMLRILSIEGRLRRGGGPRTVRQTTAESNGSEAGYDPSRHCFSSSARSLLTFPSQHHPIAYRQADILNASVGLDEAIKGHDGVSISIPGIYHFAAP